MTASSLRIVGTGYTPGGWLGMAGPDTWVLADVPPGDPIVRDCWPLVRDGADLDRIAAALQAGGRDLTFVAASHHNGTARAMVHGKAWAEIVGVDGHITALRPATDLETAERDLDRPVAALHLGGAVLPTALAGPLPLDAGVVLAAALTVHLAPVDEPYPHGRATEDRRVTEDLGSG